MSDPTPAQGAAPDLVQGYDREGQPIEVEASKAAQLVRDGAMGFAPDQQVLIRDATGTLVPITGEEAAKRAGSYGTQFGGQQALQQQAEAEYYSQPLAAGAAAGAGFLRATTLGMSDRALVGSGMLDQADVAGLARHNPFATGAGEVAGTVGGMLLGGAAAQGLGTAVRGTAIGARALGALEAAPSLVRSGLGVAGSAAEMGVYEVGQANSQAVIENHELTGERVAQAFLHGAAFGAGGHVALGALGAATRYAAGKSLDASTRLAELATGRAGQGKGVEKLVDTILPGGTEAFAADQALAGTGAAKAAVAEIEAAGKEVKARVAGLLQREVPEALGKPANTILSRAEQAEGAQLVARKAEAQLAEHAAKLDEALPRLSAASRPDVRGVVSEALHSVVAPLREIAGAGPTATKVEGYLEDLLAKGGNDFAGLRKSLDHLDTQISKGGAAGAELRKVHGLLDAELTRAADHAASEIGGEVGAGYRHAVQGEQAARLLEAATKSAPAEGATSLITHARAGIQGGIDGVSVGGGIAGPAGGVAGGILGATTGAAASYGKELVGRYGHQVTADVLGRVARSGSLLAAASEVAEKALGAKVVSFFKAAAAKGAGGAELTARATGATVAKGSQKGSLSERYARAEQAVAGLAASPQAHTAQLAPHLAGAPPQVQQATASTVQRAAAYLGSKIPPKPPGGGLTPQFDKSEPPSAEQAKFLQAVEAVRDPAGVLEDLQRGTITRTQVEALRAVYPETYRQIQQLTMQHLAELKAPLPYAKALALGILLDVEAHPSLAPSAIAATQAAFAQAAPSPPAPPRPSGTSRLSKMYSLDKDAA